MNFKYKSLLLSVFLICFNLTNIFATQPLVEYRDEATTEVIQSLYHKAKLQDYGLSFQAFAQGLTGYLNLLSNDKINNTRILSIVDFSQPSTNKRLYVIDIKKGVLLMNTLVAHGRNSGMLYADKFSNTKNSKQSSCGFYSAAETYFGKYGLSLKLDGLQKNINSKARERAIVIHAAKYVSQSFVHQNGYLGRSFGCPALSYKDHKQVINTIKGGSVFFVYSNQNKEESQDVLSELPNNALELLSHYTLSTPSMMERDIPNHKIEITK
ncbi:murein L,D-transpeptidase catalytic domain family protein [Flammeovirga pacifica]|uniref:Murein L,D-transpeptidase catalytic domain family protein n=1 Tax=Flammeovirga pacifica TaxID=915059 RepID=A0A1S1Z4S5_FLAPC|nr:murein L,D-transpeptidase catalytic domain family protein [Flammeovirga pacifica]OHX68280.1 hypothetical protein NH26_18970 [Flammeovirga pacifica]